MLVAHLTSTCDICSNPYSWDAPDDAPGAWLRRPHALRCGHVFCLSCLNRRSPPLCYLCGIAYQPQRIRRLYVERPILESRSGIEAQRLLENLALHSKTQTSQAQWDVVLGDANAFVAQHPECPLREAIETLARSIANHRTSAARCADLSKRNDSLMRASASHASNTLYMQQKFQERIRDLERQLGVAQMGGPSTQPAGGFQPREGPIASTPDPTLDVSSRQMPPRAVDTYHGALVYDRLPSPRFSQPQRERPLEPTMAEPSPQEPTVSNLEPNEMFPPRRNPVYAVVPQTNHEHTSGSERMSTGSLAQPSNHPSSSGSGRMSARSSGESLAAMLEETGIEDGEVIMPGNALGLGSMSGRASPVRSLRSRAGSFGASSSVGHAPGRSRSGSFGTSSDVDEPPFIPDSPESDYGHPPWSRINSQGGRRSDRRSSMNASSSSDVVASSRDRAFTYPSSAPFRSPAARPQHAASSPYAPPNIYSSTRIGVMPLRGTPPDPPASGSSRSSRRRGSGSSHAGTSLRNNTVPLPDDTFETHAAPGDGWGHDAWSGASPVFPDDGRESVPAFSNPNRGPTATPYPTTALGLSLESPPFSSPVSPAEFHPPPPPGRPFQAPQMGIVSPLNSEQSWSVPSPPLLENINPFRLAPIQSPPNGQPRAVEPSFGLREMNSRSSRLPPPPPPPAHHVSPASRFQRPGSYFSPAASEYTNLPLSSTLSTRAPLPAQEAVVAPRERYPNTVAPGMRSSVSERPSTSATAGPSYPYEGSAPAFASFTQAGYWMHQGQNQNH